MDHICDQSAMTNRDGIGNRDRDSGLMHAKALSAIVGLFVVTGSAFCQVKGPNEITVPVGRLSAIHLTIEGDEADYAILGSDLDGLREYDPDPKKLRLRVIGYSPGTAFVVVTSTKGGKLQPLFVVKVTITGRVPQSHAATPDPGPKPDPPKLDPAPIPVAKLYVVVVEETKQAANDRRECFNDAELQAYMGIKGHRLRVVDQDVKDEASKTPEDVKRFIEDKYNRDLPRLYIVDENGKTLRAGPMTRTPSALISLLKQYGG